MKRKIILLIAALSLFNPSGLLGKDKEAILPISDILQIATEKVPGKIIKAEFKQGLYEVKIVTPGGEEKKIYIDATDGNIIEKAGISLAEATKIALEAVSGEVKKVEFERGKYEFIIETEDGSAKEVNVDSRSGQVLKIEDKGN